MMAHEEKSEVVTRYSTRETWMWYFRGDQSSNQTMSTLKSRFDPDSFLLFSTLDHLFRCFVTKRRWDTQERMHCRFTPIHSVDGLHEHSVKGRGVLFVILQLDVCDVDELSVARRMWGERVSWEGDWGEVGLTGGGGGGVVFQMTPHILHSLWRPSQL